MKGIIIKDLYQNFGIKGHLYSLLFNYAIILINLFSPNYYGFLLMAFVFIPFVTLPQLLITSIKGDDKSGYDKILITMPVTRKNIVKSKYLLGFMFMIFNYSLIMLGAFMQYKVFKTTSLTGIVNTLSITLIIFLISFAINYVASFTFRGMGSLITITMAVITGVIFYFIDYFDFILNFFTKNSRLLFSLILVFSIALVYLSYRISLISYIRKEFK